MVLGISNIVLRKLISFLFFVCPKIILNNVAKIFMPLGMGGFIIYGHENFTIVAEKFDQ
jgi:hypothetical protein